MTQDKALIVTFSVLVTNERCEEFESIVYRNGLFTDDYTVTRLVNWKETRRAKRYSTALSGKRKGIVCMLKFLTDKGFLPNHVTYLEVKEEQNDEE